MSLACLSVPRCDAVRTYRGSPGSGDARLQSALHSSSKGGMHSDDDLLQGVEELLAREAERMALAFSGGARKGVESAGNGAQKGAQLHAPRPTGVEEGALSPRSEASETLEGRFYHALRSQLL